MLKTRFLIILLYLVAPIASFAFDPGMPGRKETKEITRLFGSETEISRIQLSSDLLEVKAYLREGDALFEVIKNDQTLGYLLSTQTKGRYDYFDYSVVFSSDFEVLSTMVLVYRSTHGAGVCSKGWLKQFNGYQGGKLTLGKNIDAISGSTFSATSIVNDIQRCRRLLVTLKKVQVIQ